MKRLFPVICLFSWLVAAHSFAGSATWNLNPTSGDWNTAANWIPATVPNGPADVATFDVSNTTDLFFSANSVEVSSIVFNAAASNFNVALDSASNSVNLALSGPGIINNSEVTQNLTLAPKHGFGGSIEFLNAATAGHDITVTIDAGGVGFNDTASAGSATFTVGGSPTGHETYGGTVGFYENSTAGSAGFTVEGALAPGGFGGIVRFNDTSTAGDSSFVVESSLKSGGGAELEFYSSSTAGNATISVQGTTSSSGDPAYLDFWNTSSAGNAVITSEAGATAGAYYGFISFWDTSTGGNATLIANGGNAQGAPGGDIATQGDFATAGDATLIANGGTNGGTGGGIGFYKFGKATLIANGGTNGGGGSIYFAQASMAAGEAHGNGFLAVRFDALGVASLGSLAGDGTVLLGSNQLTIGATNVSTEFSGVLQDTGSLIKSGTATFTLSGANTYSGGTTVLGGTLKVSNTTGSGTGTGAVSVQVGSLAGKGIISGAVTVGTGSGAGASLAPGKGASKPTTLTLQSALAFKVDGSYSYKLNTKKAKGDQVIANGVTIENGAQFDLTTVQNKKMTAGKIFTAINNTAMTPISGTFADLVDGSIVTVGVNKLQVSYSGGDGNDLTLTVVP